MDSNKILYIAQEINPYLPATPMSIIGRELPQSIIEKGYEVRTFMPKYGNINERRNQLHEVIRLSGMNIVIDDTDHQLIIKVATLQPSRMQVYFIDNDDYFRHHAVTDIELRQVPEDNDERIMFFVRGSVETIKKLRWEAGIIHTIGWIGALAPLYIRHVYGEDPAFRSSKVVTSLVDDRFDGHLDARFIEKLRLDGIDDELLSDIVDGLVDYNTLMRLAIRNSDGVTVTMATADEDLIEYARNLGKPVLLYPGDDNAADAYLEFYNSL